MDSFMGSFSTRNDSILDFADISSALNRSKLLLNEVVASPSLRQKGSILSQTVPQETIVDFDEPSIINLKFLN